MKKINVKELFGEIDEEDLSTKQWEFYCSSREWCKGNKPNSSRLIEIPVGDHHHDRLFFEKSGDTVALWRFKK